MRTYIPCIVPILQIKNDNMTCSTHGEEQNLYRILLGKTNGADSIMTLERISKENGVKRVSWSQLFQGNIYLKAL